MPRRMKIDALRRHAKRQARLYQEGSKSFPDPKRLKKSLPVDDQTTEVNGTKENTNKDSSVFGNSGFVISDEEDDFQEEFDSKESSLSCNHKENTSCLLDELIDSIDEAISIHSEHDDEDEDEDPPYLQNFDVSARHFTDDEIAIHEVITFCDSAGCPRGFYDNILRLLKKLKKNYNFDVTKGCQRNVHMDRLKKKFGSPRVNKTHIGGKEVFSFNFLDQVKDLLASQIQDMHIFNSTINYESSEMYRGELIATPEFRRLQEKFVQDAKTEICLPLLLAGDKTGTDAYQQYPLEPWLFTFANLTRSQRESRLSWRHLGFIPNIKKDKQDTTYRCQRYHNFMRVLVQQIKDAQENPPFINFTVGGTEERDIKVYLPILLILGDQLSQDMICGRKSCKGGASRIHRGCMCSYLHSDDPTNVCRPVSKDVIYNLCRESNRFGFLKEEITSNIANLINKEFQLANSTQSSKMTLHRFLDRRQKFFSSVTNSVFSQHPIRNAFEDLQVAWEGHIFTATVDDPMHSQELGIIKSLNEMAYGSLQPHERLSVESLTRSSLTKQRSSVRFEYPKARLTEGFTNMTLMTSTEHVGGILTMIVSLKHPEVRQIMQDAQYRQIHKYQTVPKEKEVEEKQQKRYIKKVKEDISSKKKKRAKKKGKGKANKEPTKTKKYSNPNPDPDPELLNLPYSEDDYMKDVLHFRESNLIAKLLYHAQRHGFPINILFDLDKIQVYRFLVTARTSFDKVSAYPSAKDIRSAPGQFKEIKSWLNQKAHNTELTVAATHCKKVLGLSSQPNVTLPGEISGIPKKHRRKKPDWNGLGSTAAILSPIDDFQALLELVLCFNSFCHHADELSDYDWNDLSSITDAPRILMRYIDLYTFKGNGKIDTKTTKNHAQLRMGMNVENIGNLMNMSCCVVERLLKTEAKGISKTAQKRGEETFLDQTCQRILERALHDRLDVILAEQERKRNLESHLNNEEDGDKQPLETTKPNTFFRKKPHFVIEKGDRIMAMDRNGKTSKPDCDTGSLDPDVVKELKKAAPADATQIQVFTEYKFGDGTMCRAAPNYRRSGPWYDMVEVLWDTKAGEAAYVPARIVCMYNVVASNGSISGDMALVQPVNEGNPVQESLLTKSFKFETKIQSLSMTSVNRSLLAYELNQERRDLYKPIDRTGKRVCLVVRPRNQWPGVFLEASRYLLQQNGKLTNVASALPGSSGKTSKSSQKWVKLSDPKIVLHVNKKFVRN